MIVIKLLEIAILHSKTHATSLHELFYFSFNLGFYCIVKYSLYKLLCLYKIMLAVSFMIVIQCFSSLLINQIFMFS